MNRAQHIVPLCLCALGLASCDTSTGDAAQSASSADTAALTSLAVEGTTLSPAFSPSITDYVTDSVESAVASVRITAASRSGSATCESYSCNNEFAIYDTGTVLRINVVTPHGGSTTYRIKVLRKHFRQSTSDYGIPWNTSVSYGTLLDTRDGQSYRTVQIGSQTWMAQNLNYVVYGSHAYLNSTDSGAKYGRLYSWYAAVGDTLDSLYGKAPRNTRGICPAGWHLPTDSAWTILEKTVFRLSGGTSSANNLLRARSGWRTKDAGSDAYGFRVLPVGYFVPRYPYAGIVPDSIGSQTVFQTIDYFSLKSPYTVSFLAGLSYPLHGNAGPDDGYSIRCLKD